jgi:hypothetical protein
MGDSAKVEPADKTSSAVVAEAIGSSAVCAALGRRREVCFPVGGFGSSRVAAITISFWIFSGERFDDRIAKVA